MRLPSLLALIALAVPGTALAAPGLGQEVYSARVTDGEVEAELRYDSLRGGPDHGEDVLKTELSYALSSRVKIGIKGEFEREPGDVRRAEAVGIEAIYGLGKIGGVDVALYGEYEAGLLGPDAIETKLLLQRTKGPFDLRLNLIAEKHLASHQPIEFGYAASAEHAVLGEVKLGLEAFGDFGTGDHLLGRQEHFVGPYAKVEIEGIGPEIELKAGYLFALGKARDDTKGQLRFALELEF